MSVVSAITRVYSRVVPGKCAGYLNMTNPNTFNQLAPEWVFRQERGETPKRLLKAREKASILV